MLHEHDIDEDEFLDSITSNSFSADGSVVLSRQVSH